MGWLAVRLSEGSLVCEAQIGETLVGGGTLRWEKYGWRESLQLSMHCDYNEPGSLLEPKSVKFHVWYPVDPGLNPGGLTALASPSHRYTLLIWL